MKKKIYNNTINDKEINNNHDIILLKKIKNELIHNWKDMSNEEIEEKFDVIIEYYKKKIQFNEIILNLESYNMKKVILIMFCKNMIKNYKMFLNKLNKYLMETQMIKENYQINIF